MLGCEYPMLIWWGPELIHLYNDAYVPVLGQRHPEVLGRPAPGVWSEAWPTVGPQADAVMEEGRTYSNEELLILMTRNDYPEEVYLRGGGPARKRSCDPAHDKSGSRAIETVRAPELPAAGKAGEWT